MLSGAINCHLLESFVFLLSVCENANLHSVCIQIPGGEIAAFSILPLDWLTYFNPRGYLLFGVILIEFAEFTELCTSAHYLHKWWPIF